MVSRALGTALLAAATLSAASEVTYRNTDPGVKYIGSRGCAGCHTKIYQDFYKTNKNHLNFFTSALNTDKTCLYLKTIKIKKNDRM